MTTKASTLLLTLLICLPCVGQSSDFSFKFYGRLRTEIFYNSRANNETGDGLFYFFPKDHNYDADGNDLNATPQGALYCLYSRLGVDIKGPNVGSAKTTAKVEADFRGSGTTFTVLRMRQVYINLDWGKSALLMGQAWHPMFGEVSPGTLNLSSGVPYQPLNRSPQIRYRYTPGNGLIATAAAIWQMQFSSVGPEGKTHNYLKNSNVPEIFLGVDYKKNGLLAGIGGEMVSLKPRLQSTVDGKVYKVDERVTSFSVEAHAKYVASDWMLAGKTTLASNLTQLLSLGGYGVTDINPRTGECKYAPFHHSMTWLSFIYGKKWQPGVFVGYAKNLGMGKELKGAHYGTGLDIGQLFGTNWQITYNLPHWKIGVEFATSTAWYGTINPQNGKVLDTHAVTNYRILTAAMYIF